MVWTDLDQDRNKQCAAVSTVMNCQFTSIAENIADRMRIR